VKEFFEIGEDLVKLRTKWLLVSCAQFALRFFLKEAELGR